VEGKNSVTSTMLPFPQHEASTDANENVHNIMLYQSMSAMRRLGIQLYGNGWQHSCQCGGTFLRNQHDQHDLFDQRSADAGK
jgi:hypothetical protein